MESKKPRSSPTPELLRLTRAHRRKARLARRQDVVAMHLRLAAKYATRYEEWKEFLKHTEEDNG